MEMSHQDLGEQ